MDSEPDQAPRQVFHMLRNAHVPDNALPRPYKLADPSLPLSQLRNGQRSQSPTNVSSQLLEKRPATAGPVGPGGPVGGPMPASNYVGVFDYPQQYEIYPDGSSRPSALPQTNQETKQDAGSSGLLLGNENVMNGVALDGNLYETSASDLSTHITSEIDESLGQGLQRRGTKRRALSDHPAPSAAEQTPKLVKEQPEAELRRAAVHSLRYSMSQCAQYILEDEDGPMSDKSRQVFGMTWLLRSCELASDSTVPRNRIYARYVSLCTELQLRPLNPAALGKLVRIVFPNIKTRRLGTRGNSKYHYCGITLLGDNAAATGSTPNTSQTTASPSPQSVSTPLARTPSQSFNDLRIFDYPSAPGSASQTVPQAPSAYGSGNGSKEAPVLGSVEAFELPPMPILSTGDPDAVATLQALYKTHCRQQLEQLRSFQIKKLFAVISAFLRGLTVPVKRLLDDPAIVRWMTTADTLLYREMTLQLSPLARQALSQDAMQALHTLAMGLGSHIEQHSQGPMPGYVVAKKSAASRFTEVLDRLLRASQAAQNAARVLGSAADIAKMKADWTAFVTPVGSRDAPCAQGLVSEILLDEIPALLIPKNDQDFDQLFEPWVDYLGNLPKRVGQPLDARIFNAISSAVITAAMRDLNRGGAESFGQFWMLRTWVDEHLAYRLELDIYLNSTSE